MKKRYILLFLIMLLPLNVLAKCTSKELNEYKSLGKNINYTYDLLLKDNIAFFNVKLLNLTDGMMVKVGYDNYSYNGTSELNVGNFMYSTNVAAKIYACDTVIRIISFNTPGYNRYADDSLCKGIEDYKLCSKWVTQNIDYETFKKQVIEYKNTLLEETKKDDVIVKKDDLLNTIVLFLINYNIYILPVIIIGCLVGIIIIKRNEKNIIKFRI